VTIIQDAKQGIVHVGNKKKEGKEKDIPDMTV
jgi:hypothetical protein